MGWDIDRFPEGEVNLELICCICTCILEDPVESPCRHVFCSQCIKTWLSNQKSCPHCRAPVHKRDLQSVVPLLKNIISKQKIYCDNKNRGCTDIIALENLQGHIASCQYGLVPCTYEGCHVRVMRKDHKSHIEVCAKRTVMCENGCEMFLTLGEQNSHNCVQALRSHFQDVTNELLGRIAKLEEIVNDLASKNHSNGNSRGGLPNNTNHHQHRSGGTGGGGGGNNRGGLNDETYSCVSYNIPSPRSYNSESSPTRFTVLHEVDNTINLDNYQHDNNSDYSVESVEPDSPLNNHHNTYINQPPRSPTTGTRRNSVNYDPDMSPVYGGNQTYPLRERGARRENRGHSTSARHRSRSPTTHNRHSVNNRLTGSSSRARRQQLHSANTTSNFDDDYDGLRNSSQHNLVGGASTEDNDDGLVLRIGVSQTVSDSSTSASSTSDSDTD